MLLAFWAAAVLFAGGLIAQAMKGEKKKAVSEVKVLSHEHIMRGLRKRR